MRSEIRLKRSRNVAKSPKFQFYYIKSTTLKKCSIIFQTGSKNTAVLIRKLRSIMHSTAPTDQHYLNFVAPSMGPIDDHEPIYTENAAVLLP